jgi:hypothetical protein
MEARPRQAVLSRQQVLVERLVHVPDEAKMYPRHGVVAHALLRAVFTLV